MKISVLATLATCVLAFRPAQAEVRLVHDGSGRHVRVTASGHGIWAPAGHVDASVLNPSGDVGGDGAPAVFEAGEGVVVAWLRPRSDQVVLSEGTSTWSSEVTIPAGGARGTPLGSAFAEGSVACWNRDGGDSTCAALLSDRRVVTVDLPSFVVKEVVGEGLTVHVLGISPEPLPEPILGLVDVVLSPRTGSLPRLVALSTSALGPGDAAVSAIEVTTCTERSSSLATWRSAPSEMGWAVLDESGVAEGPAWVAMHGSDARQDLKALRVGACRQ